MCTDVGSQFVILLFLECLVVENVPVFQFLHKRSEQTVDERGVVQNAVQISTHATGSNFTPIQGAVCQISQGGNSLFRHRER